MNNNKLYWIVPVIIVLAFSFLAGCSKEAAQGFERPPAPVTLNAAIQQDVPVYLDAVGTTVAREVVSIHPQVSGRITQIHFADGANVNRGTALFTIDPRPYQAALHLAQANLAEKQAAMEHARIEFSRVGNLIDMKAISQQDYDTRKNAVQIAEAQVKQSKAEVETARLNLDYCFIRSPIAGRAGQRLVDLGNIVSANSQQSLLMIQQVNPIYADFTVTENDLTSVQRNMQRGSLRVAVHLPEDPSATGTAAAPAISREGSLTFLDNAVKDGTGTIKLRATIPNEDRLFWPGRFVRVRLILDTRKNAIVIPADAPQNSAKGTFVYVIKPDSTAELRPVTLGQKQGDLIVIEQGLTEGEKVVISGQLGVTPGGKVRVVEEPESLAGKGAAAKPVSGSGAKS